METHRLKIKIGQHEFEAEGPPEAVNAQFEAWKDLISALPSTGQFDQSGGGPAAPPNPESAKPPVELPGIFEHDRKKNLISLRVHPRGDHRFADALLLIMYAYKLLDQDEVMVGRLKEAMALTGLRLERVDRTMEPHLRANLVLKGGTGKGGKYRLTNMGIQRAEVLVRELQG